MAQELLGTDFEIHGGGSDLIFPHHENEAAQTQAATGSPLAQIWMHNGMLRLDAEKMSKSVGNVFGLGEALERHGPETLLMYFSQGHWRQPLEYDETRLEQAAAAAARIREAGRRLVPGPQPGLVGSRAARRSSMRWRTTSTCLGRWSRCSTGSATPTAPRPAPSAPTTCGRCSTCSGSPDCSTTMSPRSPARALELARRRDRRPQRA